MARSKVKGTKGKPVKKAKNRDTLKASRTVTSRTVKRPDGSVYGRVNVDDKNDGIDRYTHNDNYSDPGWGNGGHKKRRYKGAGYANPIKHAAPNSGKVRRTHRTADTNKNQRNLAGQDIRDSHRKSKQKLRRNTRFNVD